MSAHVLVTGTLFRDPQTKSSKTGKTFVACTIKTPVPDSSTSDFWNCMCFSDSAKTELMRLRDGDKVCVQGDLKLELFEREGGSRIGRTVFVSSVLALRAAPRERKPGATPASTREQPIELANLSSSSDLDDDIPF